MNAALEEVERELRELTIDGYAAVSTAYATWSHVIAAALDTISPMRLRALRPLTPRVIAAAEARTDVEVAPEIREHVAMAAWLHLVEVVDDGEHAMSELLSEPWKEQRRLRGDADGAVASV